jgi:hypothetical protein
MKTPEAYKTKKAEEAFSAALVAVLLLIIPSLHLGKFGAGAAMFAVSVIALMAYGFLFREYLRSRLKSVAIAAAIGTVASLALVISMLIVRS